MFKTINNADGAEIYHQLTNLKIHKLKNDPRTAGNRVN
jgi:hypothetical protein